MHKIPTSRKYPFGIYVWLYFSEDTEARKEVASLPLGSVRLPPVYLNRQNTDSQTCIKFKVE